MTSADDTIIAVGSPPGRSLRGMVRLSGPATHDILRQLTDTSSPDAFARPLQRVRCQLAIRHMHLPAQAVCFHGPRSYTGQDMAELQCPGNPVLLELIIQSAVAAGARLAEPGEFTLRRFLAGKIDLTRAEGIAATIAATGDGQLKAAMLLRQGALGRLSSELVEGLAQPLALVEAGIDFVDQDDVVPIGPAELDEKLHKIGRRLEALVGQSRSWSALEALPRVVLAGRPSVGKSTLFNALLGRSRAVISPMPGTTRDVLAEPLVLSVSLARRVEVMLVDLAGFDNPVDALDRQIQSALVDALARADVILHLQEADADAMELNLALGRLNGADLPNFRPVQTEHPTKCQEIPVVQVRTKADLSPSSARPPRVDDVVISAKTGAGLEQLRRAIINRVGDRAVSVGGQILALQPRHEAALRAAIEHVTSALELLAPQRGQHQLEQIELIAAALRDALDELAGLGGRMTSDDIIGRIFATFCVGK